MGWKSILHPRLRHEVFPGARDPISEGEGGYRRTRLGPIAQWVVTQGLQYWGCN